MHGSSYTDASGRTPNFRARAREMPLAQPDWFCAPDHPPRREQGTRGEARCLRGQGWEWVLGAKDQPWLRARVREPNAGPGMGVLPPRKELSRIRIRSYLTPAQEYPMAPHAYREMSTFPAVVLALYQAFSASSPVPSQGPHPNGGRGAQAREKGGRYVLGGAGPLLEA